MFRPHNRIFLWSLVVGRAEDGPRRGGGEEKKERESVGRRKGEMALGEKWERRRNKNKTEVGGFHGLLTAERNSKRGYPPTRQYQTSFNEVTGQRQFPNQVGGSSLSLPFLPPSFSRLVVFR